MDGQLDFHTPSLRSSGQGLTDAAGRLQRGWQSMLSAVQGMGELFGDDLVSSLIGTSYQIAQQMAEESYGSAIAELQFFGEGLVVMADTYDGTEQGIKAGIDQIGRAM